MIFQIIYSYKLLILQNIKLYCLILYYLIFFKFKNWYNIYIKRFANGHKKKKKVWQMIKKKKKKVLTNILKKFMSNLSCNRKNIYIIINLNNKI